MSMTDERMPRSILMVLDERARQVVEEGYDAAHDQQHEGYELARAGASYAIPPLTREYLYAGRPPDFWPWRAEFWKPTPDDRVRELVKGAALIVAEIDRLLLEEASDEG
jgi:hypothetical protein